MGKKIERVRKLKNENPAILLLVSQFLIFLPNKFSYLPVAESLIFYLEFSISSLLRRTSPDFGLLI